jgi:hypothetical protein
MTDQLVVVENFTQWRKAVKELDAGLDKELKVGLKAIGSKVTTKAQAEAGAKGLLKTGDLIKKIAPSVTQKGVAIVSKAKRESSPGTRKFRDGRGRSRYAGKPFPYPMVYEYGGRGGSGSRAFLAPAVQKSSQLIMSELEKVIETTASKAGFH